MTPINFQILDFEDDDKKRAQQNDVPLPFLDMRTWDETPAPERPWLIFDRIPSKQPTLFTGEGAIGKSLLLLQLVIATVLGREWLGAEVAMGPAIYYGCEDDGDELHRRLENILRHYNVTFRHLILRGFYLISMAGQDAVLAATNRSGRVEPTALFHRLYHDTCNIRPRIIALDTASDIFAGKENDRSEVRQFMSLLRKLAIDASTAVLLAAHPSQSGIASGAGTSGSTQWHNSVRARMYLKAASDDNEAENGLRELQFKKNQYGPTAHRVLLRWQNGLFLPVSSDAISIDQMLANDAIDDLFLKLLRQCTEQGRNVSDRRSSTYAPAVFADDPEAKGRKFGKDALAAAMARLFAMNKIKVLTEGRPSHQRSRIVENEPVSNGMSNTRPAVSNGEGGRPSPVPLLPLDGAKGPVGRPAPVQRGSREGTQTAAGDGPARRPTIAGNLELIGAEPPGTVCVHCAQASGTVYLIRDPRQGVASEPLHENCAAAFFKRKEAEMSWRFNVARAPSEQGDGNWNEDNDTD